MTAMNLLPQQVPFTPPSETISLTQYETAAVASAALSLWDRHHGRPLHDDQLLYDVESAAGNLPSRLQSALRRFRDKGNLDGVLLIDGLPVEDQAATPSAGGIDPDWAEVPVSTFSQLMVMSTLGSVISYSDEKEGRLIQDVFPKRGQERRQENSGCVLLELHTEDGFLAYPPHFLSLLCIRADHDKVAATVACSVRRVLPLLTDELVSVLYQQRFRIAYSSSFTGGQESEVWSRPMSILSGPSTDPDLVVDFHGMEGLDSGAQDALDALRDVFVANLTGAVLLPGQLVVVDNRVAVHGRTAFLARFDDKDRWLRRCFAVSDLREVRDSFEHGRALRITPS